MAKWFGFPACLVLGLSACGTSEKQKSDNVAGNPGTTGEGESGNASTSSGGQATSSGGTGGGGHGLFNRGGLYSHRL